MTDINIARDCCSPNATLTDTTDLAPSDTTLEVVQDCCSSAATSSNMVVQLLLTKQLPPVEVLCPACGYKGKAVDSATVKAMLAVNLLAVQDIPYLFCREAHCPVVYFSADGVQTFTTDLLRERVFQKEPDAEDVFVCYCFRHTAGSIRAELTETGQSTVVDTINIGIQTGQCACDLRNPQGACCLGNVSAVVKRIQQELNAQARTEPESI